QPESEVVEIRESLTDPAPGVRDFSVRITSFETIGVLPRVLLLSPRSRVALEHRAVAEPARVFRVHYAARSPISSGIVILLRMPTCRTSRSLSLPRHAAGTCRAITANDQTPVTDARRRVRHHQHVFLLIPSRTFDHPRSWVQIDPARRNEEGSRCTGYSSELL